MPSIESYIQSNGIRSVADYIRTSNMEKTGTWGTDIEILTLVHLLNTPVYTYMDDIKQWQHFTPGNIDPTLHNDVTQMAMYLTHYARHFEVVLSTVGVAPQVVHGTGRSTRRCH